MARVRKNMAMQGLTGLLGDQLLLRTDKAGRTIVGARPTFNEGQVFTPAQVSHHEDFRAAVTYAKGAKGLEVYAKKAAGTPTWSSSSMRATVASSAGPRLWRKCST